jgi:outer membrane immunogenic protein
VFLRCLALAARSTGQIGYRWQSANWIFGVEGQGNWADFTGSNISLLFAPDFNRSKTDSFGLITGQVGYAWNNVLFYVKGGAAVTGDRYEAFSGTTGALLASANETEEGHKEKNRANVQCSNSAHVPDFK